jgi:hypothetical protein
VIVSYFSSSVACPILGLKSVYREARKDSAEWNVSHSTQTHQLRLGKQNAPSADDAVALWEVIYLRSDCRHLNSLSASEEGFAIERTIRKVLFEETRRTELLCTRRTVSRDKCVDKFEGRWFLRGDGSTTKMVELRSSNFSAEL